MWKKTVEGFRIFCNNTSLHGFSYIYSRNCLIFRITFFILCLFSILFFIYLTILQVFSSNKEVISTTILTTAYPVQRVPFPAVTIGNFNLVYKDNVRKVAEKLKPYGVLASEFDEFVQHLAALIIYTYDESNLKNYSKIYSALDRIGYGIDDLMKALSQPCSSLLKKCVWQTNEISCSSVFKSILTNEGHACSFNYHGVSKLKHKRRLIYTDGAGDGFSLHLLLDTEQNQYVSSNRPDSYGLSILVHDSIEYPHISMSSKILFPRELMTISVTPTIYESTEQLKLYNPQKRKCWFEHEGWDWASNYSFIGCIEQCKEEGKFKKCDCVSYHYPNKLGRQFCNLEDTKCIRNNKMLYSNVDITDKFKSAKEEMFYSFGSVTKCNCHPQCNERVYNLRVDKWEVNNTVHAGNLSTLIVYYNTVACTKIQRDLYMTWDQILASLGGLFGLCLGGSVVSLVEIFYFAFRGISKLLSRNGKVIKTKTKLIKVAPISQSRY